MSHTPGPWTHYDDSKDGKTNRHEIAAMGKTVCHIYHSVPAEDAANARLIAAAPEMYEMLKAIEPYSADLLTDLEKRLLAVIAKAEGR
jgi:hypothetical protein